MRADYEPEDDGQDDDSDQSRYTYGELLRRKRRGEIQGGLLGRFSGPRSHSREAPNRLERVEEEGETEEALDRKVLHFKSSSSQRVERGMEGAMSIFTPSHFLTPTQAAHYLGAKTQERQDTVKLLESIGFKLAFLANHRADHLFLPNPGFSLHELACTNRLSLHGSELNDILALESVNASSRAWILIKSGYYQQIEPCNYQRMLTDYTSPYQIPSISTIVYVDHLLRQAQRHDSELEVSKLLPSEMWVTTHEVRGEGRDQQFLALMAENLGKHSAVKYRAEWMCSSFTPTSHGYGLLAHIPQKHFIA